MDIKEKVLELEKELFDEKEGALYRSILQIVEKPLIENILERTYGNQIKAARILGLNRNTLRTKIKRLGINVEKWKNV
jgi:two-component system nitrogen regulation response regulator GlnG